MTIPGGCGDLEGQNSPQSSSCAFNAGLNLQLFPDVNEDDEIISDNGKDCVLL
jgi:hypothetical protein